MSKLRSDKELLTELLFFSMLICMYALLFGIAYGELRERGRLLQLKEMYTDEQEHSFKNSEKSQKADKEANKVKERVRPDLKPPDHTHD